MQNAKHNTAAWPLHLNALDASEQVTLFKKIAPTIANFLNNEKIPFSDDLLKTVENLYLPFAKWLTIQHKDKALVVGINGAQGAGKTTLSTVLRIILEKCFKQKVVSFSIDDLYKTQQQRLELAEKIHPLFVTRGVPGTHDVRQGIAILKQLTEQTSTSCQIPVFDKAKDNPLPTSKWTAVSTNCDIILFEGWCVGAKPQTDNELKQAINSLEKYEDKEAVWRHHINQQLQTSYAELFDFIDIQLLLKIPCFDKVLEWRTLQEKKLANSRTKANFRIMNDEQIRRFIMHFERITTHVLNEMPNRADIIFELNSHHQISNVTTKR